ncbi:hypothetical protein M0R45_017409 [Rubus argutus]|uniref:Pentatricopeptide repeat-containing protein n=1 Tax=Rubus argutus TaxID=59490 RepID=A0AAW1XVG0_RUBAR
MMRTATSSYSYSNCSSSSRRGMYCLHSPLIVVVNKYLAFFHSSKSTNLVRVRDPPSNPKVTTLESALKVFDEMLHRRPLPSVVRFTQILGQLAKLKHYSAVITLRKQMGLIGIGHDVCTLNIIINCYCHLNQIRFSISVLAHFFNLGLQPTVPTFNTLINSYILENRVAEAARLFGQMMEGGHCKPNEVTFNTLIKGFCMMGNNSAAIQLLGKMEETGCKPDIVSYNTIIDSLSKDTLVVDALNLLSEMISNGIAPNVITYTSLIHGVCKLGKWKEGARLLNEMANQNIFPDIYTFNVLVDALSKEGMVVEAKSVVEMMIKKDIEHDIFTFNSLMDGYCLRGEMDEAKKVFDVMVRKGSMVNVRCFNRLINGYCKHKKIDEAKKVFQEMYRGELVPDTITLPLLLKVFAKQGEYKKQRSCSLRCKIVANFQMFEHTLLYLMAYVITNNFVLQENCLERWKAISWN